MNARSDRGFTLTEMVIVVSVLGFLISGVYMFVQAAEVGQDVSARQSQFSRDITQPLHRMDKFLSQNTEIENSGGLVSDAFTLTAKGPMDPDTYIYQRRIFSATVDKQLSETVYNINGRTGVVLGTRSSVWSKNNANRLKGQMFRYIDPSGATTTTPEGAGSVEIEIWTESVSTQLKRTTYYSSKRQVFFRNR